jgi:hypothetical protein
MIQQSLRNRLYSAPRRVFGVFVLCGLNLVITPCAMALQMDQDCPHAPQVVDLAAGHHSHHDATAATHNCKTLQANCCDIAAASLDTRGGLFKITPDHFAVATTDLPWHTNDVSSARLVTVHPPDPVGFSPPLHKLYCVYLD